MKKKYDLAYQVLNVKKNKTKEQIKKMLLKIEDNMSKECDKEKTNLENTI